MRLYDVIIIGAGMAGFACALELKRRGIGYLMLEAQAHAGGRAASVRTKNGTPVDLGAHWLHGEHNPLEAMLKHYHLSYDKDTSAQLRIYADGGMCVEKNRDWLEKTIDHEKASRIKRGELPDIPLPELAKANDRARTLLGAFSAMWNGLTPPLHPSALEFLTDESTPGGAQLTQGMGALFNCLLKDAGSEQVRFNTPIRAIAQHPSGVLLTDTNGGQYRARNALLTASLGVLNSGIIRFDPPLSAALQSDLARIAMGKVTKIIVEVDKAFLERRAIPPNLALELLDAKPPHFCHVRSAGLPLISLFASGAMAQQVEEMSARQALAHLISILSPVEALRGFDAHITDGPIVTRWAGNPYTQGAYSACLPGGTRTGPRQQGQVYLCGDTFDTRYPASLAGAALSGRKAAEMVAASLS